MINFSPVHTVNSVNNTPFSFRACYKNSIDTVSFGAKHKKPANANTPENSIEAVKFGEELYRNKDLTFGDIENYVKSNNPNVKVLPVEKLKEYIPDWRNYQAYVHSDMTQDFKEDNAILYIAQKPKIDDPTGRLLYSMTASHEYTHLLQTYKNTAPDFLKKITNENYEEALLIMTAGEEIFKFFDNQMQAACIINPIRNSINMKEFQKYNEITPTGAKINYQQIFAGTNSKTRGDFDKKINTAFDALYTQIMIGISSTPEGRGYLNGIKDKNSLYGKIKKYCSMKAEFEKEAYTTEASLAKKVLNQSNLNIDAFSMYYELLQKIFAN
ncbi:MAG: hypothetical protein LUE64_02485 [Candidatus Gastranaerophilales bacterium]|nr:hypothetical protein [Candidatus Gastranaerophilales bacterium]